MKGKKKLLKKVVLSFAIALITLIGVANNEVAAAGEAWDTPAQVKTPAGNLETGYYILSAEYSYGTYTSEKTTTFTKVTEDEINANKEHLDGYLYFDATTATMTVYGDIAGGSNVTYFDVQNGKLTISGSGSLMFDTTESVFINTVGSAAIVTKDFTGDFDISSTSVRKAIDDYDYIDITTTGDVRIVGGAKVALSETTNFIISAQNVNLELDDCNYFSGCKNITAKEKFTISTGYGFEGDSSKGNNVYTAKDIDITNTGSPVLFRNGDEFKATNKFTLSTNHDDIAVKSIKIDCGSGTIEYTGAEKSDKNIFNCDTAIKSDGDFTVESIGGFVGYSHPFSLEAGGNVKITASGNAPLISSQTTIDATGNLDITGEYIISAQSSIGGEASLKANNITIANNYSDSIPVFGSNVKLEAKGDIEITNKKSNILGTGCTFKITKAKNVTINSATDETIFNGLVEIHATGDLNIINKIDSANVVPSIVFDMETLLYVDGDVVIKTNNNQLICDTNLLIQGESEALGLGKDGKPGAKSVYFETAEGNVPMMCPGNIYVRGDFTAKKVDTKTLEISGVNPMFASEAKIHADGDILIESQWNFLNAYPLVIDKFSTEKSESNNVTINTNGNGNEVQFAYQDLTIECDGSLKITHQPGGLTKTNIDLKAKDIAISTGASHCENKMSEGEDSILASLSGNVKMRAEGDIIIDAPTAEAYEDGNGTVDIESETTVAKQNYAGGTHIYNCHHVRMEDGKTVSAIKWVKTKDTHTQSCDVCNENIISEAAHEYGAEGDSRYTCEVCSYVDEELKAAAEKADKEKKEAAEKAEKEAAEKAEKEAAEKAEKEAAEKAAAELKAAKESAKEAIDKELGADAPDKAKEKAEEAKKNIDEASTIEAVETAKNKGIAAIREAKEQKEPEVSAPKIVGNCQIPNPYGEGVLIGFEPDKDGGDEYYGMILLLDCTKLAAGDPNPWFYSTGKRNLTTGGVWTQMSLPYGYYWTLFRIYDKDGNLVDEQCYGFENIY